MPDIGDIKAGAFRTIVIDNAGHTLGLERMDQVP
jgi:hypothetical protein